MDLMLALSQDRVHTLLWSDRLLDEWEHHIVREKHRSPQAAAAITRAIRDYFPENRVPKDSYRHLLEGPRGPDPDDLHHIAAAAAGAARTTLTVPRGHWAAARICGSLSPGDAERGGVGRGHPVSGCRSTTAAVRHRSTVRERRGVAIRDVLA